MSFLTTYHDPNHCFPETRDGTFPVTVVANWFPRSIFGACRALCMYLRIIIGSVSKKIPYFVFSFCWKSTKSHNLPYFLHNWKLWSRFCRSSFPLNSTTDLVLETKEYFLLSLSGYATFKTRRFSKATLSTTTRLVWGNWSKYIYFMIQVIYRLNLFCFLGV